MSDYSDADKNLENQEEPPAKKSRTDDEPNTDETKKKILAMATTLLLDSSDSEDDDCESLMVYYMLKKIRTRKMMLLKELLTLERESQESEEDFLEDIVPAYTEEEFRKNFRITRSLYEKLCKQFAESACYAKFRGDKRTSAEKHMAVFLWFAGQQATLDEVGERFDLSKSTVSSIIERMTTYISSLSPLTIKWPADEKKVETSKYFEEYGFPKAIGCIDCTYIHIQSTDVQQEDYIDRHGNFSLCLQGVCDEDKKFIHLIVGYPGSTHASSVYANSKLCQNRKELCGDYYLLGNSAYPNNVNLVTPYRECGPLRSMEEMFNENLKCAHISIQHAFCMLKQRFRQLQFCKLQGIAKLCNFIRACCVLHNMANEDDFEFILHYDANVQEPNWEEFDDCEFKSEANALRDTLAEEMYAS